MTNASPIDDHESPVSTALADADSSGEAVARPAGGLVAFAEAIEASKGDLAGTLERLAQSLYEKDRRELLDEMLARERENPGAFLSGALAGFVIGRGGADFRSLREAAEPAKAPTDDREAGIVVGPMDTAQQGPGGPGHLEPGHSDDDRS
ncbi:hypothetical protein [Mesorhizobium sp. CAU 1741]|uniref:hypothetical protein n=1 Tax=Mesorhizobium sp. CAU 1741 TaxID=3140366 RepID=UPI00325A5134